MNLFIQPNIEFEKTAAEVALPEDPNTWPKEILDELYKQVPYIADFQPHVNMTKVDAERRYAMGHIDVSNQSEAQQGTDPQQIAAAGVRSVRIPIIVRNGKLSPFDVLVNDTSNVLPLTEARLRQAIFRPQAFDVTSQTPGDQSMIGQLYPPYRQNGGMGGGGATMPASGMGKMGSALEDFLKDAEAVAKTISAPLFMVPPQEKRASILSAILPTLNAGDLDTFWDTMSGDEGLHAQFRKNASATYKSIGLLANHEPYTAEKTASITAGLIKPTVVQISKGHEGYLVKAASHYCWEPYTSQVDRGELVQRFGTKVAMAVDTSGAATLTEGADMEGEPEVSKAKMVTAPGVYKVRTTEGQELVGYVITDLIDTDGESLPLAVFTNGSQATVQSEIHGEPAGSGANLPSGPITGMGLFFTATPEGIKATIPLKLGGSYEAGGEPGTFQGETFDGRPVEVSVQPNIEIPVGTPDGKLLIPGNWHWSPMDKAQNVALAGSEDSFNPEEQKEASALLTIRGGGSTFSLSGAPVEKLAQADKSFIGLDDAMFILAGLGVHQGYGATKLAHASTGAAPEVIKVGRAITTSDTARTTALESATEKLASFPMLKRYLVKEASHIPDPMAVDTVLSLGFINPENMSTFVSYLPQIDSAQMKMCELLLAARLGLQSTPESALERAVRSTEEVIEGLKVIAFSS